MPDPGNPQALNRYSYVYNNPLRYTDPTGQWPDWVDNAWECAGNGFDCARDPIASAWDSGSSATSSWVFRAWNELLDLPEQAQAAAEWVASGSLSFGGRVVETGQEVRRRAEGAAGATEDAIADAAGEIGGAVETAAAATREYFSDPENVAGAIQLVSGAAIGPACAFGPVTCGLTIGTYAAASITLLAYADSPHERIFVGAGTIIGLIPGGPLAVKLSILALSSSLDALKSPQPAISPGVPQGPGVIPGCTGSSSAWRPSSVYCV